MTYFEILSFYYSDYGLLLQFSLCLWPSIVWMRRRLADRIWNNHYMSCHFTFATKKYRSNKLTRLFWFQLDSDLRKLVDLAKLKQKNFWLQILKGSDRRQRIAIEWPVAYTMGDVNGWLDNDLLTGISPYNHIITSLPNTKVIYVFFNRQACFV